MKKLILTLIALFFVTFIVGGVSSFPTQAQNTSINLTQSCDTCTYVNITSIQLGDGSVLNLDTSMTKDGTFYNYTLSSNYTTTLGEYCVYGIGDDGEDGIWLFCFLVTPTGDQSTTSDSLFYGVLLIILFVVDVFGIYMVFALTLENPRNEQGDFMGISLQKYVKVVIIGLMYGMILLTLNLMNSVSQSLFSIPQFSGIISSIFLIMLRLAWVWTVIIIIWLIIIAYRDNHLIKDIRRSLGEAGG